MAIHINKSLNKKKFNFKINKKLLCISDSQSLITLYLMADYSITFYVSSLKLIILISILNLFKSSNIVINSLTIP